MTVQKSKSGTVPCAARDRCEKALYCRLFAHAKRRPSTYRPVSEAQQMLAFQQHLLVFHLARVGVYAISLASAYNSRAKRREHMETRTRWLILWLLVLISVVRSMDAVNFSVAAKQIMPEYGLSNVQMGTLYTVFTAGYALFHIPGGWLGDTVGPRRVLALAILWWSGFTMLTAVAGDWWLAGLLGPLTSFMVVRFCIGMGEGAAYPNSARAVASWMATDERAAASGLVFAGIGVGYGLAPPVVSWIMVHYGWRPAFYVFAAVGVVMAGLWYWFATDQPEQHPWVSPHELQRIRGDAAPLTRQPTPWRTILSHPNVWLLMLANFGFGYGVYIFQSWFYLYLVNVRGFSLMQGGVLTTGPFIAVSIMGPIGGICSDLLVKRYGVTWGRRATAVAGLSLAALCLYVGARVADPYLAVLLLSLGDGFLYFAGSAALGAVIDMAGSHSGTVYGITVTATQIGGAVAPTLTPIIADRFGWEAALQFAGFLALLSAVVWLVIDAGKKLIPQVQSRVATEQVAVSR
jgi:ACS family glucarate transporter-like MFS transporter